MRYLSGVLHNGKERDPCGPSLWRAKAQFGGPAFLGQRYDVSTLGWDERAIRAQIKNQENEGRRLDQLNLWR